MPLVNDVENILKQIDDVFAADKKTAQDLKKAVLERCHPHAKPDEAEILFLKNVKNHLNRQELLQKWHRNTSRQESEINKAERNPGKIDIGEWGDAMWQKMGIKGKTTWYADDEKYGFPHTISGDRIKEHENPVFHSMPSRRSYGSLGPKDTYLSRTKSQRQEIERDLKLSKRNLQYLVEKGHEIPKSQAELLDGESRAGKFFYSLAETTVVAGSKLLHPILHTLGKGMWSHSDYRDKSFLRNYHTKRNSLMHVLTHNLNRHNGNAALLERIRKIFDMNFAAAMQESGESGLLDSATFEQINRLITQEVLNANYGQKEEIERINKIINDLNDKVVKDAKEKSDKEDEMFKLRALQAFLILAPFMGIAYLGIVADILETVFSSGSLAEGIATLATIVPGLGELIEILRIDVAIYWLLGECPIISNIIAVPDLFISSGIAQGILANAVYPLITVPLAYLGAAALCSIPRTADELEFYLKYQKIKEGHELALKKAIKTMTNTVNLNNEQKSRNGAKAAIEDMVKKSQNIDAAEKHSIRNAIEEMMVPDLDEKEEAARLEKIKYIVGEKFKGGEAEKNNFIKGIVDQVGIFSKGSNFKKFLNKKFELTKKVYENEFVVRFANFVYGECGGNNLPDGKNLLARIVGDEALENMKKEGIIEKNGKLSQVKLNEYLSKEENKSFSKNLRENILLFNATGKAQEVVFCDLEEKLQSFESLKNNREEKQKKLAQEEKFLSNEYVFASARGAGLVIDENSDREKEAARLKESLIKLELQALRNNRPESRVVPVAARQIERLVNLNNARSDTTVF